MRRAARTDANHSAIVGAFQQCGATVVDLSGVAGGCPDLLVGYRKRMWLVEVKDGNKPKSKRKLTPDQAEFHAWWRGDPIVVIESVNAAINLLR